MTNKGNITMNNRKMIARPLCRCRYL